VATLVLTRSSEAVQISVENSGAPVSDEVLRHLGERYYQADQASYWGSGLGLSIVDAILTQMHSRITFSKPEHGGGLKATFSLGLCQPKGGL